MNQGVLFDGKLTPPVASIGTAAGVVAGPELDVLAGVAAGTGAANKALVAGADGIVVQAASKLATEAAAGFTAGVGTIYKSSIQKIGGLIRTSILIDLTGLGSSTTDLDIIGTGAAAAAHIGQLTAALNGTVFAGQITCLEVPVTGVTDIDIYWATEATGKFDDAVAGLTETALLTNGGAWTLALTKAFADPVGIANGYIYMCNGAAGTVGTYTAGKFLIEFLGY